jgi:hypothetical protein
LHVSKARGIAFCFHLDVTFFFKGLSQFVGFLGGDASGCQHHEVGSQGFLHLGQFVFFVLTQVHHLFLF